MWFWRHDCYFIHSDSYSLFYQMTLLNCQNWSLFWLQGRNPLFIWGEQDCGYRDTESPQGSRLGTKPSLEITADWIWRGFYLLSGCSWRAEHCKRFGHQHLWAVGIDLNNICHQLTIFFFVSGTALNLWSSKTLSQWKKLYLHSQ